MTGVGDGATTRDDDRAAGLLRGPRGRRLCLSLAFGGTGWSWSPQRVDDRWAALRSAVHRTRGPLPAALLWTALVEAVDSGRYWQEPDDLDHLLTDPAAAELLRPVAELVVASPDTRWWWDDVDRATQTAISWPGADGSLPAGPRRGDPDLARAWSRAAVRDEIAAARERPADPRASWSGSWWSAPSLSGLPSTARTRPGASRVGVGAEPAVPVGLHLVEDEMGWGTARTWPVRARRGTHVLEVRDERDWAALVSRHPLPVTAARRHDWYRCTGRAGEWVVPDWGSVAEEADAVHVTVGAWLALAGRAVEVPSTHAATVLAGWDPDAAWWLTDAVESGDPTDWVRTDDDPPDRWRPRA